MSQQFVKQKVSSTSRVPFYDVARFFLIAKMALDHIVFTWQLHKKYVWAKFIINSLSTTFLFPFLMGVSVAKFNVPNKKLFKRFWVLAVYFIVLNLVYSTLFHVKINWFDVIVTNNSITPVFDILWALSISSLGLIVLRAGFSRLLKTIKFVNSQSFAGFGAVFFLYLLLAQNLSYNLVALFSAFVGFFIAKIIDFNKISELFYIGLVFLPFALYIPQKCCFFNPALMIFVFLVLLFLLSKWINNQEVSKASQITFKTRAINIFAFMGQNTLLIYLTQVVLYGLLKEFKIVNIVYFGQVVVLYLGLMIFVYVILKIIYKNSRLKLVYKLFFKV